MTDDMIDNDSGRPDLSNSASSLTVDIEPDEKPSEAVIRAVSALTDTGVLDLEPLYDVIRPDHLDELFDGAAASAESSLSFTYAGCAVTVTTGTVHVHVHSRAEDGPDAGL